MLIAIVPVLFILLFVGLFVVLFCFGPHVNGKALVAFFRREKAFTMSDAVKDRKRIRAQELKECGPLCTGAMCLKPTVLTEGATKS